MNLLHTLRSLFGATERSDVATEAGFEHTPDTTGLNFHLPAEQLHALKQGRGSPLQKAQLTLLNMLHEQQRAAPIANGFSVSADIIAALDDGEAEVLGLPPRLHARFLTRVDGRTGNSSFRVTMTLKTADGDVPFRRKGPYLYIGQNQCYRLNPGELLGLEAWDAHREQPAETRGEANNLRLMAMLQTAARSGMDIDLSHFEHLQVVIPQDIGVVATRLPDGSLELCPTLGDGSTPDQLQNRWHQLQIDDNGGVLRVDNRIVVLDADRMAGIRNVFSSRRIPADKVADFINSPTAFLDAALVNLDVGFSVRVAGIGRIEHIDFGSLDSKKIDWFSLDAQPAAPEALDRLIQSTDDLNRFKEHLTAARREGADTLHFDGHSIDISIPERIDEVLSRIGIRLADQHKNEESPSDVEPSAEEKVHEPDAPIEHVTVLLKDASQIHADLLDACEHAAIPTAPDWSNLSLKPFPHQEEGIEWMLRLITAAQAGDPDDLYRLQGALLADDMGLGKTYMALVTAGTYLESRRRQGLPQKPILVIAPLSLLENWEDEINKIFKSSPFRDVIVLQAGRDLNRFRIKGVEHESRQLASLLTTGNITEQQHSIRYAMQIGPEAGASRLDVERRLVLCTYQTLRDYQFSLCKVDWGIVIFDEAQNIKNPNTLQTRAAKGIKADFRLLATGTPVENSLGDFWCLMDTAQPGLLGDWKRFRETWIKPINSATEADRDEVRIRLGEKLRQQVGQFMLRRIKEDQLKGLPRRTTHSGIDDGSNTIDFVPALGAEMSGQQLQVYDQTLNEYRQQTANNNDQQQRALSTLARLRSISLHPRLGDAERSLLPRNARHARQLMGESAKLLAVLQQLEQIQHRNEKVILFLMTKQLQRLLKQWLDLIFGLDIAIINGDTKAVSTKADDETRKQLIARFEQQPGFNILIMSPIAAGVGLTVVGANHVIHVERHWNPAKEAQATDRIYRIGQKRDVHVHLPILKHPRFDAFDVHLDRLLRNKIVLRDAVVSTEAVSEREMSQRLGLL